MDAVDWTCLEVISVIDYLLKERGTMREKSIPKYWAWV
jgi:hypothetical protein